jgi:hypothetical protein
MLAVVIPSLQENIYILSKFASLVSTVSVLISRMALLAVGAQSAVLFFYLLDLGPGTTCPCC